MSMATNSVLPSSHLIHHFRRPQPPQTAPRSPHLLSSSSTFLSLFFKPLSALSLPSNKTAVQAARFSVATAKAPPPPPLSSSPKSLLRTLTSNSLLSSAPLSSRSLSFLRRSNSSDAFAQTSLPHLEASLDGDDEDAEIVDADEIEDEYGESDKFGEGIDSDEEEEEEEEEDLQQPEASTPARPASVKKPPGRSLNLSVKEKKELASYAHSLGKKLKCQLVGKSGVNENVAASFIETLEANELLKIKIHRTCPGELEDVVNQLETLTGSVVVGQIGRTVIIYRPSLTKLKAEEKKEHNRRVFMKRRLGPKPAFTKSGQGSRSTARARPGRSRI